MSTKVNEAFAQLLHSPDGAEKAMQASIRADLIEHGKAGRAVPIWRDERVVWVVPDENGDFPNEG